MCELCPIFITARQEQSGRAIQARREAFSKDFLESLKMAFAFKPPGPIVITEPKDKRIAQLEAENTALRERVRVLDDGRVALQKLYVDQHDELKQQQTEFDNLMKAYKALLESQTHIVAALE